MNYNEFLHSKVEVAPVSGFEVRTEDINPALKKRWIPAKEKGNTSPSWCPLRVPAREG